MKYTSGPWHARQIPEPKDTRFSQWIDLENGAPIADVRTRLDNEHEANAALIAAAPELLATLELAQRYLAHPDVLEITKNMALSGEAVNNRIAAAIAKAKGE